MSQSGQQFSTRIAAVWGIGGGLLGAALIYSGYGLLVLPLCLVGGAVSGWLWAKIMWHALVKYSLPQTPGTVDVDKRQR
jgi:hypothetical protein